MSASISNKVVFSSEDPPFAAGGARWRRFYHEEKTMKTDVINLKDHRQALERVEAAAARAIENYFRKYAGGLTAWWRALALRHTGNPNAVLRIVGWRH